LKGVLLSRGFSTVEVETVGGVVYEVEIPLSVAGRLPQPGAQVELRTLQVVREDSAALYGFLEGNERELFRRLLTASGVGARLALAMLSTFTASRLARALVERDIPALTQVSGVGRKTAERISLELSEKVEDLALTPDGTSAGSPAAQGAVSALVGLGYSFAAADEGVRKVLRKDPDLSTEELVRKVLEKA
jgi:Holliday junction DNA helicase RuvA